jgi:hypothetical protein
MKRSRKVAIILCATLALASSHVLFRHSNLVFKLASAETHKVKSAGSAGGVQTITLGRIFQNPYVKIKMDYEVTPFTEGYQDLFQTADMNGGIRVEVSPSAIGLVYATPNAFNGQEVNTHIPFNTLQHLEIDAIDKQSLRIRDSAGGSYIITSPPPDFAVNHITVGQGFNETRSFKGIIRNFSLSVCDYKTYGRILTLLYSIMGVAYLALIIRLKRIPTS